MFVFGDKGWGKENDNRFGGHDNLHKHIPQ